MAWLEPDGLPTKELDIVVDERAFFLVTVILGSVFLACTFVRVVNELSSVLPRITALFFVVGAYAYTYICLAMGHQMEAEAVPDGVVMMVRWGLFLGSIFTLIAPAILLVPAWKQYDDVRDFQFSPQRRDKIPQHAELSLVRIALFAVLFFVVGFSAYCITIACSAIYNLQTTATIGIASCFIMLVIFLLVVLWKFIVDDMLWIPEVSFAQTIRRGIPFLRRTFYYFMYAAFWTVTFGGAGAILVVFFVIDMENRRDSSDSIAAKGSLAAAVTLFITGVLGVLLACIATIRAGIHAWRSRTRDIWKDLNVVPMEDMPSAVRRPPKQAARVSAPESMLWDSTLEASHAAPDDDSAYGDRSRGGVGADIHEGGEDEEGGHEGEPRSPSKKELQRARKEEQARLKEEERQRKIEEKRLREEEKHRLSEEKRRLSEEKRNHRRAAHNQLALSSLEEVEEDAAGSAAAAPLASTPTKKSASGGAPPPPPPPLPPGILSGGQAPAAAAGGSQRNSASALAGSPPAPPPPPAGLYSSVGGSQAASAAAARQPSNGDPARSAISSQPSFSNMPPPSMASTSSGVMLPPNARASLRRTGDSNSSASVLPPPPPPPPPKNGAAAGPPLPPPPPMGASGDSSTNPSPTFGRERAAPQPSGQRADQVPKSNSFSGLVQRLREAQERAGQEPGQNQQQSQEQQQQRLQSPELPPPAWNRSMSLLSTSSGKGAQSSPQMSREASGASVPRPKDIEAVLHSAMRTRKNSTKGPSLGVLAKAVSRFLEGKNVEVWDSEEEFGENVDWDVWEEPRRRQVRQS
jgi:signal transduction histidine kinase